jgi:histidinol-phosphate aminotransferase
VRDCIREEIRALTAYAVAPSEGLVKLDAMENPYLLPYDLQQELSAKLAALHFNRYPDPSPEALKSLLRKNMGIPNEASVVLGNGSDELIQMIMLAAARPGSVMLGVEPSFIMFRMIATFVGMRYESVTLNPDFTLSRDALLSAVTRHQPAVVFLAYPNNPTGNCFDAAILNELLDETTGLVVVDEAYFPFTDHSFLPQLMSRPNLLVMRTLSKLGLAGVRLGFLSGPPSIVEEIDKVRLPYNISAPDQLVATEVLSHAEVLRKQAHLIRQDRDELASMMSEISGVEVFSSEANFLLFRVNDARRVFDGLLHRGILVKDLSRAHPLLSGCLRVTVGTPDENQSFLSALRESAS